MSKNIVLVVMDTARALDTRGVRKTLPSSHLDRLATEGSVFTKTFSNAPWTLPSHASMFTGTYTSKHGTHAGHKRYDGKFPTLAELLSEKGYQTVGVTNNAWVTDEFGLARGFDKFYKVWQYIQTNTDYGKIKLTTHGTDLISEGLRSFLNKDIVDNFVNGIYGQFLYRRNDYGAKRTNSLVEDWINDQKTDDPFFLFINYLEPHLEYRPPQKLAEMFLPPGSSYESAMGVSQNPWEYVAGKLDLSDHDFELLQALYRAEIAYLDERIGELRTLLASIGEWNDTVFVVVGDHGENIGDYGLMDHQYSLRETLLHVPLFVEGGRFNRTSGSDELVQTLDLFPTILDVADVPIPSHSQGVSFHPKSSTAPRERVFAEYLCPQPTIDRLSEQTDTPREELSKYDRRLRTIRTENWQLIRDAKGNVELYSTGDGFTERPPESSTTIAVGDELESELESWLRSFAPASGSDPGSMSEDTKQKLEDLGYLQ